MEVLHAQQWKAISFQARWYLVRAYYPASHWITRMWFTNSAEWNRQFYFLTSETNSSRNCTTDSFTYGETHSGAGLYPTYVTGGSRRWGGICWNGCQCDLCVADERREIVVARELRWVGQ